MTRITFEFHQVPGDNIAMTFQKANENPSPLELRYAQVVLENMLALVPHWLRNEFPDSNLKGQMFCQDMNIVNQVVKDLKSKK